MPWGDTAFVTLPATMGRFVCRGGRGTMCQFTNNSTHQPWDATPANLAPAIRSSAVRPSQAFVARIGQRLLKELLGFAVGNTARLRVAVPVPS